MKIPFKKKDEWEHRINWRDGTSSIIRSADDPTTTGARVITYATEGAQYLLGSWLPVALDDALRRGASIQGPFGDEISLLW